MNEISQLKKNKEETNKEINNNKEESIKNGS